MFAAAPLIVSEYAPAASALSLDWFEEIRDEAAPSSLYVPTPRLNVTDDDVAAVVAQTTEALREITREMEGQIERMMAEAESLLADEVERLAATAFTDTITENVADDPAAVGWRRFARPEACKFCKMLAARGAVYTESTARFAAHGAVMSGNRKGGNCMCIAGPAFGGMEIWGEATPMQYMASKRKRTDAERAALRKYLNHNFPDAPG